MDFHKYLGTIKGLEGWRTSTKSFVNSRTVVRLEMDSWFSHRRLVGNQGERMLGELAGEKSAGC